MTERHPHTQDGGLDRLAELLADEQLGQLSPEDRAELDKLLDSQPGLTGPTDLDRGANDLLIGEILVAMDDADTSDRDPIPAALASRLEASGLGLVGAAGSRMDADGRPPTAHDDSSPGSLARVGADQASTQRSYNVWPWFAAACVLLTVGVGFFAWIATQRNNAALESSRQQLAALRSQIAENETTLADARRANQSLREELATAGARELELAERLAEATSELAIAELAIAKYEAPQDPSELAQQRRKLLEVPDTFRVAWQPFDLPDAPAEQRGVQGDVVWNDELERGYLRFVGLEVNDPAVEQYQVWVIDERGLEQKVSGGVFNASADGEVIVPIDPAIDVGRVALFAITVENPGGTWVPDLQRRVVVAPRESS